MFGYASDETPSYMPTPIWIAHRLSERLTEVRKNGDLAYLRPDGKTQATIGYDGDRPVSVETVVISSQHAEGFSLDQLRADLAAHVIEPVLARAELDISRTTNILNPAGAFVIGGPVGDAGLTGRKIIVDTYGGMARHGGGAFSGKDPSKVDRSAAYAMRWVAKNVVAAGLAKRAEIQIAYAIGQARPVGTYVETFGTETVDPAKISAAIAEIFDLRPRAIIDALDLKRPIYAKTAAHGHFGRDDPDFTWERLDRVDDLKAYFNA
jgi:S-adenosylmethionine synthetase